MEDDDPHNDPDMCVGLKKVIVVYHHFTTPRQNCSPLKSRILPPTATITYITKFKEHAVEY